MKKLLLAFFAVVFFSSCKDEKAPVAELSADTDQQELTTLIRDVLTWSDSKDGIDLLPVLISEKDSVYRGFDMIQHSKNIMLLDRTGFFTDDFKNNYTNIMQTLDKRLRDKTYDAWDVGYLPTFRFNNGANAWCNCQDNFAWDEVETEVIRLNDNEGELYWKFGGIKPGNDPSWKEFRYKFKVARQNGTWKIDWMEGFDYETSIKSDGL